MIYWTTTATYNSRQRPAFVKLEKLLRLRSSTLIESLLTLWSKWAAAQVLTMIGDTSAISFATYGDTLVDHLQLYLCVNTVTL